MGHSDHFVRTFVYEMAQNRWFRAEISLGERGAGGWERREDRPRFGRRALAPTPPGSRRNVGVGREVQEHDTRPHRL